MKRIAVLAIVVAFVIFLGEANAGVFGNDNLELTPDQELIVRAVLGEQAVVRVKVAENIPLPQIPTASAAPVAAPVAQAPVNYQPQQPVVSLSPVQMVPPVQPRQPEAKAVSTPDLAKSAAPVAMTPAPAKPAASFKQEQQAKAETAPVIYPGAIKIHLGMVPLHKGEYIFHKYFPPGNYYAVLGQTADNKTINGKGEVTPNPDLMAELPKLNVPIQWHDNLFPKN